MNVKNVLIVASLLAVALLCSPATARADMVTDNGMGLSNSITLHANGTIADGQTISAGQMLYNWHNHDYIAYCVDINHYAGSGDMTARQAYTFLHNGSLVEYLYNTYAPGVDTGIKAAALQAAIWEVVFETGSTYSVSTGYLTITNNSAVTALANQELASLPTTYGGPHLYALDSVDRQDVVVPEPATMSLLGLGALALLRRRRTRSTV